MSAATYSDKVQLSIDLTGTMHPTDRCPQCGSRVMYNEVGNRWCIGEDCTYHIRNGQVVTAARVRELGDRCPVRSI